MRKTPLLSRLGAYTLFTLTAFAAGSQAAAMEARVADFARLDGKLSRIEIPFVANTGLHDPAVAFKASTFEGAAFVTRKGQIVYSLSSGDKGSPGWTLTESAVTSRALRPVGNGSSEACVSYFLGNHPTQWRANVETHRSVLIGKAWSGISLELRAHGNSIEKLFTVDPGADVSQIRMRMGGANSLRVQRDGSLLLATGLGQARFTAPVAYQDKGGVRHAVSVRYRVKGSSYGFVLGDYDPDVAVVIDPLLQATYLGGGLPADLAFAVAIHPISGEVFVAGATESTNFPGTTGGAQPAYAGNADVFVARLNATLTTLIQATYLGGSGAGINGSDAANALAIHPTSGEVFVAGTTRSGNFPGTTGGPQPAYAGNADGFVARLNASLTMLNQATYLGGSGPEQASALAIHPISGEVFVGGRTASTTFPGTTGGAQSALGGGDDAFIARLDATLTMLSQATYLGGSSIDYGNALAIHPTSGEVFAAGITGSTNFPSTTGGAQPTSAGGEYAFVARLDATLTGLSQATYFGGSEVFAQTRGYALAIHPTSGEVVIAGGTLSTNLPGTDGGAQPAHGGGFGASNAFVARLASSLSSVSQATYLGGVGGDEALALAIHPTSGDIYVGGVAASTNFPGTAGGAQPAIGGGNDAFVARLNSSLTTLSQATYLGGSDMDQGWALAIHPISGEVFVAGSTISTNFPGTTGGPQPANAGGIDGFVARLSADLAGVAQPGAAFFTVAPCRVADTRDPPGPFGGPSLAAGASRTFTIAGQCNIPIGALAVFGNVTISLPTAPGHLSIYPAGTSLPVVSTINFQLGQTRANNGIFLLGTGGGITVTNGQSGGTVDFILDLAGYFSP